MRREGALTLGDVDGAIQESGLQGTLFPPTTPLPGKGGFEQISTRKRGPVRARNAAQDAYLKALRHHELVFAEGGLQPAQLSPMAGAIGSPATGRARFVGRIDWRPGEASSRGELTTPGLDFVSPAGPAKGLAGTIAFTSLAPLATAPGQTVRIASVGGIAPLSDVEARFVIADETIRLGHEVTKAHLAELGRLQTVLV